MTAPTCPTCAKTSRLTGGKEIYPHRKDLFSKNFYKCDSCGGYVGCHPDTTKALGTPANAQLRKARGQIHAIMDPIWRNAWEHYGDGFSSRQKSRIGRRARTRVYAYLADQLGIDTDDCHVGMFDLERCRAAHRIVCKMDFPMVRAWAKQSETPEFEQQGAT